MPIWLRKFTFNKIKEFYEQENERHTKATRQSPSGRSNKSQTSEFIDFANPDKSAFKKLTP